MKFRINLILLGMVLVFSKNLLACSVPDTGAEYDSLVEISIFDNDGYYHVKAPKYLANHLQEAKMELVFMRHHESGRPYFDFSKPLSGEASGKYIKAKFKLPYNTKHLIRVQVIWQHKIGGMCSVFGRSKFLTNAPNKSLKSDAASGAA